MSTVNALFIFLIAAAGLGAVVWIFWRGWSPEQLPLWAGLIWGTMLAMVWAPRFLPVSIRWSDEVSIVQVGVGLAVVALSIKCGILLLRYGSTLTSTQRTAAWLGLAPLGLGVLMLLVVLWSSGYFSAKK